MAEAQTKPGVIGVLLDGERRFVRRLEGVLYFQREIYREIESDPHAIPQAMAVVVATSVLVALGQGAGGLVSIFAGLAGSIFQWMAVTGLVWIVGRFATAGPVDFSKLLRCTGFAYAWLALQLLASLPILGILFAWAAVVLVLVSLVIATREVLETDTSRAALVCGVALGVPLVVLLWLGP
ncbi:MAG TPA: YIP1 family protein [Myxococcota bacterium]|nr:YIP1 family protein [Myxococcota bacterium]